MKIFDFKLRDRLLSIIYPKSCELCGDVLYINETEDICGKCRNYFKRGGAPAVICDEGLCLYRYEGEIRKAILGLKYFGNENAGRVFGRLMYESCIKNNFPLIFDEIIAVAASKERNAKRGYNQAEIIAKEFSALSGIPLGSGLIRMKDTKPQNRLRREERAENVKDAFGTDRDFTGKRILLVDDIYTTGSTIKECGRALYNAGAVRVGYVTAAASLLDD